MVTPPVVRVRPFPIRRSDNSVVLHGSLGTFVHFRSRTRPPWGWTCCSRRPRSCPHWIRGTRPTRRRRGRARAANRDSRRARYELRGESTIVDVIRATYSERGFGLRSAPYAVLEDADEPGPGSARDRGCRRVGAVPRLVDRAAFRVQRRLDGLLHHVHERFLRVRRFVRAVQPGLHQAARVRLRRRTAKCGGGGGRRCAIVRGKRRFGLTADRSFLTVAEASRTA
jgi:hypothetical protein